jgi:alginate O-acetyltransferase complex protein AlgI
VITEITDNIDLPAWAQMWLLAFGVWLVCKLVTRTFARNVPAGYFLWPGMDPRPFVTRASCPCPAPGTGKMPVLQVLSGIALLTFASRIVPEHSLAAGWLGMIGLVLLLHFGLFDLIAIAWRAHGVPVEPIMQHPLGATSVADFWSRWNRGFRDLAFRVIFRPLHRRGGIIGATLATFIFSGVVHDLVISVPARAAYGLPTLYFLIQGIVVLFEKSRIGRRMHPAVQRAIAYITLIAPLPLLFHRPFIERVFVPFLIAITRCNMTTFVTLASLLRIGGLMHFGILIASALVPQVLDWRSELGKLAPLTRQLVWVHGIFIVLTIIGLGVIATTNAPLLAAGSTLARCVCAFVAIFWLARLSLQFALFDPKEYLTTAALKLGYYSLTLVFAYLALTFGWAAVRWM